MYVFVLSLIDTWIEEAIDQIQAFSERCSRNLRHDP